MSIGALPHDVTRDLEALKLRLAGMTDGDLAADQAAAMHTEISAIRLQLKRLALERKWVEDVARRALED